LKPYISSFASAAESAKSINPEVKLDDSANNEFGNERITIKGIQINIFVIERFR